MKNISVELVHSTPLYVCSDAIRTCWMSQDKSDSRRWDDLYADNKEWIETGPIDKALIDRIGNKNKHSSTLEHLYYNFHIYGISRACLQELARHRIASLSVKSSRYTLKELKKSPYIFNTSPVGNDPHWDIVEKYCVLTEDEEVNLCIAKALSNLKSCIEDGISNDVAKYCLPEAYRTELAWSINARSLRNFLTLRSSKSALLEIRILAGKVFEALPDEHKYLFEDIFKESLSENSL